MRIKRCIMFKNCEGKLYPTLGTGETVPILDYVRAEEQLLCGEAILGDMSDVISEYSSLCMARCTVYCLLSLVVISLLNRLGSGEVPTLLCAVYGIIFIVLIMRTLDSKVTGFEDGHGIRISFVESSITFASGAKFTSIKAR